MKVDFGELSRQYLAALDIYLREGGEAALSIAYELGRRALVDGVGILDLIALHRHALQGLVPAAPSEERSRLVDASSDFFSELLSPFEMTFRGYRQANEELQRLNENLAGQKQAVESANRELEAFSYSVSHDLRAPLRSIDGFSQVLLEDCADKLDTQGKKYLGFVREAAQHMSQLIDDLLELSRVSRSDLSRTHVDLGALARRVLDRLRAGDPKREIDFVIDDVLFAEGDPRLLELVLQNLVGNAWKFTSKREGARIEVGQRDESGRRVYFVRDNGAGFNMSYAKKLFGVFQRLHAATDFEGTGVGLAIVQRIVHRHDGEVWAEAQVDQGATFYFTLTGGRPDA
jgi:light-regulated signal transduction histidine kinase (bacteriophytochrome)